MATLAFELLARFMWGSLFMLFWVSRTETSERFLAISARIAFATAIAAFWLVWKSAAGPVWPAASFLIQIMVGWLIYCFINHRAARITGFILVFSSPTYLFMQNFEFWQLINFVLGSWVIGGVFSGQFLGHWYLNVPNLNIRELSRLVGWMKWAVLAKGLESCYTLFFRLGIDGTRLSSHGAMNPNRMIAPSLEELQLSEGLFSLQGDLAFGLGTFGLLMLITRLLWGILAPVVLAIMVEKSVEIRATQSATGILYAMCVMVIIGEGTALYLKSTLGLPF